MPPSVSSLFSFLHTGTAFYTVSWLFGASCDIDYLGLGITYITELRVQGILMLSLLIFMPSLYSHSNFNIYLSPLSFSHNANHIGASIQQWHEQQKNYVVGSLDYSCIYMYIRIHLYMHVNVRNARLHGPTVYIGGLLANTVHC